MKAAKAFTLPAKKSGPAEFTIVVTSFILYFCALFSPVLVQHKILGDAADQLVEALPNYLGSHVLWNDLMMLGYPSYANPVAYSWYPLRAMAMLGVHSYDYYEISAFVIAAVGTYYLTRELIGRRAPAVLAASVYATSGFMISQIGHIDIVYPAAWVPSIVFAAVRLRARRDGAVVAGGAFAIAFCALSGQPQVLVYALYLVAALVLARTHASRYGCTAYLACASAMIASGIGLAAVLLVPLSQLAALSVRHHYTFSEFNSFATPLLQVPVRMLFPYVFGRTANPMYRMSNYDLGAFAEMTNYVGLGTLALVAISLRSIRRNADVLFFACVAVISLALTTGNQLGLGFLTYHMPGLSVFRAPGRHAMELSLACAVLSGYGLNACMNTTRPGKLLLPAITGVCALLGLAALVLKLSQPLFQQSLLINGAPRGIDFSPFANASESIPILVLTLTVVAFLIAMRFSNNVRALFIIAPIVLDLTSFGLASYWNYAAFSEQLLSPPVYAGIVRNLLSATHTRALSLAAPDVQAGLPPNLNVLWQIPQLRGYVPLELSAAQPPNPNDPLDPHWLARAAVEVVVVPPGAFQARRSEATLIARGWNVLYAGPDATVFKNPKVPARAWLSPRSSGTVAIRRNQIVASCKRACMLETSDAYYPGWVAKVAGRKVDVFANGAFRAVRLKKGQNVVTFTFRPRVLIWGGAISLATLVFLALIAVTGIIERGRKRVSLLPPR